MFNYREGRLCAEQVPLHSIAEAVGTPVFVYSAAAFRDRFREFETALSGLDHLICYAMKANSNQAVLHLLAKIGAGFDAVSGGEIARAFAAGARADKIVFSGVGKSREELRFALDAGVRHFNVESEPELLALNDVAASAGQTAPIAVRVNPDVDAKTHHKISTGKSENKFGVPISRLRDVYRQAASLPALRVVGLDVHIGSQLTSLEPFESAFRIAADAVAALRADGHSIERLDLGGGLGITYGDEQTIPPTPSAYCDVIRATVGDLGCEIEIEPGRYIAGNSGILLSKTLYLKEGEDRRFLVLDAAMNDLPRPAIYGAWHDVLPVRRPLPGAEWRPVDIVGPICESGDTFARQRLMPPVSEGDLLAFSSAGAYAAVMASEYNTRPLAPEVLVEGDKFAVVRPRPSIDEIIAKDRIPSWLSR